MVLNNKIKYCILFITLTLVFSCKTKKKDTSTTENYTSDSLIVQKDTLERQYEVLTDNSKLYFPTNQELNKKIAFYQHLGFFEKIHLKNGVTIIGLSKGIEKNIINSIESNKPIDKKEWHNFSRVTFIGNTTKIDETKSIHQIKNLIEILRAYPKVNIKIGGYTDSEGDARDNFILSDKRAENFMKILIAKGINRSRLRFEGYGENFAIATNETEKGRALNRRVSCRLTKK